VRGGIRSVAAAVATVGTVLASGAVAQANTFEVTLRSDPVPNGCTPNHCSLREAVLRANNQSAGRDTIVLPSSRRYRLEAANADPEGEDGSLTGDLDVTNDPLTIRHPGRGRATVDGRDLDRVIGVFAPLLLKRVTVTGGNTLGSMTGDGGGILTHSALRLQNSQVIGNRGDHGGGIAATDGGSMKIVRSRIAGNVDTDAGGGLYFNEADPSSVSNSKIVGNRVVNMSEAGGISLFDTNLRISRTTISGNTSEREGGGIVALMSQLRVTNSTVSGNRAFEGGGGLYQYDGTATIVNSTITQNRTLQDGGGIAVFNLGELDLNAVTIARNLANSDSLPFSETGGGLANNSTGAVEVRNSILALNQLGPGPRNDCTGDPITSGGGNLLSSLGPSDVCLGFEGPGDAVRSNPKLAGLRKNGGPTKTIALKKGSAAIGRARASAPSRDQRGERRRNPDSGAYER
jgi:hypothetical protein